MQLHQFQVGHFHHQASSSAEVNERYSEEDVQPNPWNLLLAYGDSRRSRSSGTSGNRRRDCAVIAFRSQPWP
ncbi:hypothetical protein TIFTF001_038085 [Ficus carica]|uniref:Uncharacterized protein n=1 Tax=Ficus carica TaxID=3494 RepID=A0AA88JCR3_FICCA|nr:hypothetical protein TIFTF001_038083 [Ficus carica]GMN69035.1 hypothetical protein TIFTF001_038085 [Ficus carica]